MQKLLWQPALETKFKIFIAIEEIAFEILTPAGFHFKDKGKNDKHIIITKNLEIPNHLL